MSDGTADLQLPVGRPAAINELRGRTGLILPRGQDGVRFWEEAIDTDQGSGACRSADAPSACRALGMRAGGPHSGNPCSLFPASPKPGPYSIGRAVRKGISTVSRQRNSSADRTKRARIAGGGHAIMTLSMARREIELPGKYLGELREANEILSDVEALRGRMEEEGYLLLRGLFERERVLEARRQLVEVLAGEDALDPDHPPMEAVGAPGQRGGFRGGANDPTPSPAFRAPGRSQARSGCLPGLPAAQRA